jgi:hypothetical protein
MAGGPTRLGRCDGTSSGYYFGSTSTKSLAGVEVLKLERIYYVL